MSTTLTVKGQVTIPKRIRDALSLAPGCSVDFAVNCAGEVLIHEVDARPRRTPMHTCPLPPPPPPPLCASDHGSPSHHASSFPPAFAALSPLPLPLGPLMGEAAAGLSFWRWRRRTGKE